MRRASHESLNNRFAVNFYPTQEKEAALFVRNALNDCSHWEEEIQRYLQYFVIYSTTSITYWQNYRLYESWGRLWYICN